MKVKVLKNNGEDAGRKATLADNIFNIEPNDHDIYLDVKQFLANQRQGTHKSKERAEITAKQVSDTSRIASCQQPMAYWTAMSSEPAAWAANP